MGTRFLAVLAVVALGASSAMVGLTMASGEWETVGEGLEPGQAYAVSLNDQADRLKLELANLGTDAVATFSVYAPGGERAGFFSLDASTKTAEVVAGKGVWTLFVYKAQGTDLQVAVHGAPQSGRFMPADVERRETILGNIRGTQELDSTYTAMVGKEPVLANVYLKGSARNLVSELRTEKGIVEMISEQEVSAAQTGVIVDARGERTTFPQNLARGPFTARVTADSISGSLVLVTLYVVAPEFLPDVPDEREMPDEEDAAPPAEKPERPHRPHKHAAPKAPPARPAVEQDWTECGTAASRVPFALEVEAGMLRVTLQESTDPWITVFDPLDGILATIQLEEEGQSETVALPMPGEYVLYSRGMDVLVEVLGDVECELRELRIEPVSVAVIRGEGLGSTSEEAPFELSMAPLEFGLRMSSPDAVGIDVRAVFTGPEGEAAQYRQSFGLGLFGGSEFLPLPFGGPRERGGAQSHGYAEVDASKLVSGEWLLNVEAGTMNGDLEAFALHYLRDAAEEDEN